MAVAFLPFHPVTVTPRMGGILTKVLEAAVAGGPQLSMGISLCTVAWIITIRFCI